MRCLACSSCINLLLLPLGCGGNLELLGSSSLHLNLSGCDEGCTAGGTHMDRSPSGVHDCLCDTVLREGDVHSADLALEILDLVREPTNLASRSNLTVARVRVVLVGAHETLVIVPHIPDSAGKAVPLLPHRKGMPATLRLLVRRLAACCHLLGSRCCLSECRSLGKHEALLQLALLLLELRRGCTSTTHRRSGGRCRHSRRNSRHHNWYTGEENLDPSSRRRRPNLSIWGRCEWELARVAPVWEAVHEDEPRHRSHGLSCRTATAVLACRTADAVVHLCFGNALVANATITCSEGSESNYINRQE
jgi:hypothetical protein